MGTKLPLWGLWSTRPGQAPRLRPPGRMGREPSPQLGSPVYILGLYPQQLLLSFLRPAHNIPRSAVRPSLPTSLSKFPRCPWVGVAKTW